MSEIKIGDLVEFVDNNAHEAFPIFYPETGTIGTVVDVDENGILKVQWPTGATICGGLWHANPERVRRVES